jgi:hypothetical protein
MAIIGDELEDYVIKQITARQTLHGSGVGHTGTLRTDKQINLLNSNTSWIKLASGVSISGSNRLTELDLDPGLTGTKLAKNNILFSGTSKLKTQTVEGESYTQLEQREGFLPRDDNSSYTYGSFGFSPMPGIESADIKTLTRGSLKKATVKLTANNKQQFDIIDLLYMRLGYTVLLEWGNSIYTTNGFDKEIVRNTLIEDSFFNVSKGSYFNMLNLIKSLRDKYNGNYDALLGKISNFNWTFNPDGSYSIELTIISLGDVIESLKSNLAIDRTTQEFFNKLYPKNDDGGTEDEKVIDEEETYTDVITSMLAIYKYINKSFSTSNTINIFTPDKKSHHVGNKLSTEQAGQTSGKVSTATITTQYQATIQGHFIRYSTILESELKGRKGRTIAENDHYSHTELSGILETNVDDPDRSEKEVKFYQSFIEEINKKYKYVAYRGYTEESNKLALSEETFGTRDVVNTVGVVGRDWENERNETTTSTSENVKFKPDRKITFQRVRTDIQTVTIENPISGFFYPSDAFKLLDKEKNHYLRFGALLQFIRDKILIKIDTEEEGNENPPIFDIDVNEWNTHMYSLPNQISLDPRVCIVKNLSFKSAGGTVQVFNYLDIFKEIDNGKSTNDNAAYPLNIYLNFDFILECLKADEKGNVSVYQLISNICTGLNKALGGINNLEPIIDEENNILQIIDTTPIPGYSAQGMGSYKLQIYGYNKTGNDYISNFVRKVNLKTAITPEYATMITVGATAGGYVKGTEATAFSKWNTGLTDRFKEKFIPATSTTATAEESKDEPYLVYKEEFIDHGYSTRYGFTGFYNEFKLSDNLIEKNISVATEYYKWLIAKNSEGKDVSGGTVGFIPFKLGLTLDGISGIKIYNVLRVNTEFLPKAYGKTVDLIVTGVSHRLNNNDWETSIESTVMPKTGAASAVAITAEEAKETLNEAVEAAKTSPPKRWPYYSDSDSVPLDIESPSKGNPPNYNSKVSFSDSIKKKYFPIIKSINNKTKGIKLLALVMAQKEGFYPSSRSYKTNNPGNIGNTDSGANSKLDTLEIGIKKQIDYLYNVAMGKNENYPLNKEKNIKPFYSKEIDKNQKNYQLTPYLPGYKFKYEGTLEQFIKIYSTGARGGNSYLSMIISYFRKNGFKNVTEKTTLAELIKLNNSSDIIL